MRQLGFGDGVGEVPDAVQRAAELRVQALLAQRLGEEGRSRGEEGS